MDNGTMLAVSKKYHQRRPIGAPHFLLAAILFFNTAMSTLSISCAIPVGIWGGLPYTEDSTELDRLTDEYGMTIIVTTMKAGNAVNSFLPLMKANQWLEGGHPLRRQLDERPRRRLLRRRGQVQPFGL